MIQLKKLTELALYATLSLAIFALESAIPPLLPIPGIKLGLSNIITLILLRNHSLKDTALVLTVRILLSAFCFGQAIGLFYSIAGGFFSVFIMAFVNKLLKKRYLFLTSIAGGISHNLGQLFAAWVITRVAGVLAYLPFLVLGGIVTGLFTGLCAYFAQKYLIKLLFRHLPS